MKKLITKIESNRYVRLISITAVVLGAFITIASFFGGINEFLYSNIFISKNISKKMDRISAGQSINFFRQELGSEMLQREVSEKYSEYIFDYKNLFIQTLVDNKNNEVVYWAITNCNSPVTLKRQVFSMAGFYTGKKGLLGNDINGYTFGDKLILNKSKFSDIFKNTKGDFKYFISGATANSYIYESVYLGNPSAYQTIIIGINDVCNREIENFSILGLEGDASEEKINEFRKLSAVNTYGETAPFYGDEVLKLLGNQHSNDSYITFGVDRIKVRYFNQ